MSKSKIERNEKGKSLIDFPEDYIVIDIETTGFSPQWDSIIEISGIKYDNDIQTAKFSTLVRPDEPAYDGCYVSPFIENLTGINNDMLLKAPLTSSALSDFKNFIGGYILIGHNVSFDINFLYDNFEKYLSCPLTNDFINTMRISRWLHPDERQTLSALAKRYQIDYTGAHRSLQDCIITKLCFDCMKKEILDTYQSYKAFFKAFNHNSYSPNSHCSSQFIEKIDTSSEHNLDVTHPLYNKVCVFTGALETFTRSTATKIVEYYGGTVGSSVTRKTNYLILGNNDYCASIKDGKSTKQKKAEQLKLEGYDIEIIPENVFLDMLNENESEEK